MNFISKLNLNPDGKIIFKNFSYLSLLRAFNILSQYILVSFLVRTLGSEKYGILVWALSIIQYLIIIVNFGFNTYAAKYIPENIGDQKNLNRIFSAILFFKLFLFLISSILFIVLLYNFPAFRENYKLLLILLGLGLGEAIFPIWLFQGKEKLEIPTKIVFVFKVFLVLVTLSFISSYIHLYRYAYFLTISQIMIGLFGLIFAFISLEVRFESFSPSFLKNLVKEAFIFFIGGIFSKSFNFASILLIGLYYSMEDVASFDISIKILAAFQLPFETLSMVIFPTIARTKNLALNQKFIFLSFAISLVLWGLVYWQADFLISLLGGEDLLVYSPLLQTLSILIPIVVLTYFLGTNTLVAFGYQNQFNYSFIFPSIIYILILLYLWKTDSLTFELIIYCRILVEILMVVYRLFIAIKYRLIFISR